MGNKLEEEADEILKQFARKNDRSMREIGILDRRRMGVVQRREIPLSLLKEQMGKKQRDSE